MLRKKKNVKEKKNLRKEKLLFKSLYSWLVSIKKKC